MSQFADYSTLDPILDAWAKRHGVDWIRKDRDWNVRTLWWPLPEPESVQLWLGLPENGQVTVHVCHNTTAGGQNHTEVLAKFDALELVLNERFATAQRLATKLRGDILEKRAPL